MLHLAREREKEREGEVRYILVGRSGPIFSDLLDIIRSLRSICCGPTGNDKPVSGKHKMNYYR